MIGPEVGEEVQGNVEKGEKSEHAAEADEVGEFEEFAEGRDAKGEDQKPQRPITGGVLQEFNGMRTEIACDDAPDYIGERDQAGQKDVAFGQCAHQDYTQ